MKVSFLFYRLLWSTLFCGLSVVSFAGSVVATAKDGDLEISLILEGDQALLGKPYPIEVVVRNAGKADVTLFKQDSFFRDFDVKVFNLHAQAPAPLTLAGKADLNRALVRMHDVVLHPGEELTFFHPFLGWHYDLSLPSRYRIELTMSGFLRTHMATGEPPTLAAEFLSNPDPDMRNIPQALQRKPRPAPVESK